MPCCTQQRAQQAGAGIRSNEGEISAEVAEFECESILGRTTHIGRDEWYSCHFLLYTTSPMNTYTQRELEMERSISTNKVMYVRDPN